MKQLLRIPRVLLPQEEQEVWATPDYDDCHGVYLERVAKSVGGACSTLAGMYSPLLDKEDCLKIKDKLLTDWEGGVFKKYEPGLVCVKRTLETGDRIGIMACIDLEAVGTEKDSLIRITEEPAYPDLLETRKRFPLEFPTVLLFYNDKRKKVLNAVEWEFAEELYNFDLNFGGGHIEGCLLPKFYAKEVFKLLEQRADPCYFVASGQRTLLAACVHWKELKRGLSEREKEIHPARYLLAELVNVYDDAVNLYPYHRVVTGVDIEEFCYVLSRTVKCKREGNLLFLSHSDLATLQKADDMIETIVEANHGELSYCREDELELVPENGVAVVLNEPDKEDIFPRLKSGKRFPKYAFFTEGRFRLEGREIDYD